jgi:cobalamin biosynthesis protein CbiG
MNATEIPTAQNEAITRTNVCKIDRVYVGWQVGVLVRHEIQVETMQWGQPFIDAGELRGLTPERARAYAAALLKAADIADAWAEGRKAEGEP